MDETLNQHTDALERTLKPLIAHHEALLKLLERKRLALRAADDRQVAQICTLENENLREIAELETQRPNWLPG